MFTIICILPDSYFFGTTEEVERETDFAFERAVSVYGHLGLLVYPKGVWRRAEAIPCIEVTPLEKYPGDETN
jgi:hypothetical protein